MSFSKKNIFKILLLLIGIITIIFLLLIASLPGVTEINSFQPESTVYNLDRFDWNKRIVAPVRKYVTLQQISPELRTAVIISEDDTFFGHSGINLTQLKKAFQESLKKRRFARGASTITMQLARNAFLTKKKTIIRKLKEIILAKRIEKVWSKQQIFEYYLNIVEWGENIYGAEAAARFYFDKPSSQLNLAEAAMLAGILPNPILLNPLDNWSGAKKRQLRVLNLIRNAKLITADEFKSLITQQVYLRGSKPLLVEYDNILEISIFENALKDPRIPERLKRKADSTGIIFLPEEK
ncbi:MAG: monofunctional biosynthetic peptidoglycan transglycosylase [bacterium]|nr:MAG: monofunctional biosynthetic peptidoglycan transglycosylase [bacterium]